MYAFRYCNNIVSLKIPESLHKFSINTFGNRENLNSIEVDNNNTYLDSRDNCNAIIRKNGNTLIYGCNNSTIPNGVEKIDYRAFEGCTGLTSIVIPNSVRTIGERAFWGCVNLSSITLPDSITYIGEKAFSYGNRNRVYYIPKGSKKKFMALLPKYNNKIVEV